MHSFLLELWRKTHDEQVDFSLVDPYNDVAHHGSNQIHDIVVIQFAQISLKCAISLLFMEQSKYAQF